MELEMEMENGTSHMAHTAHTTRITYNTYPLFALHMATDFPVLALFGSLVLSPQAVYME